MRRSLVILKALSGVTFARLMPYRLSLVPYQRFSTDKKMTLQQSDCEQLLKNLEILYKSDAKVESILDYILEVSMIVWQLKSYIPRLEFAQLKFIAEVANKYDINDETFCQKVFDRSIEYQDINKTLAILDLILSSSETLSNNFYSNVLNFIDALSQQPSLLPEQTALCCLNYGMIASLSNHKSKSIQQNLAIHAKECIPLMTSKDLRFVSLGISMAQFPNTALWEYIDRQVCATKMEYEDLVRVATAFTMIDSGSDELWKMIEEDTINKISSQKPEVASMVIMFYKQSSHGNQRVYNALEQFFLENYDKFQIYDSVLMFSGFAAAQHGGSELWELFETDLEQMIAGSQINEITMLIHDCLLVTDLLGHKSVEILLEYIRKHGAEMHESIRGAIEERLQQANLLNEELTAALQK